MTVCTLAGQRLDTHDMAKILIREELNTPFIGFKRNFNTNSDMSIEFYRGGDYLSLSSQRGIYVFYRRILNSLECLYVGYTGLSFQTRGHRWMKELECKSRHDETHPGAMIAREKYGVKSTDNFYMKIIPYERILYVFEKYDCDIPSDINYIDEHIAYELESLCNINLRGPGSGHRCGRVRDSDLVS